MDNLAIPVSTGFTWTAGLVAVLNVLVGSVLVAVIRSWPAIKKIAADREANLLDERAEEMSEMRKEIKALVARLDQKDKEHCDEREADRERIEAERAVHRHEVGNLKTAFNSLLMLLKRGVPVDEAVAEVEKMRAEHLALEALEKAAFRASLVKGSKK